MTSLNVSEHYFESITKTLPSAKNVEFYLKYKSFEHENLTPIL